MAHPLRSLTTPAPLPDPPKVPGLIPWIRTESASEVPPVRGPTSHRGCGAMHPGAPKVREPVLQPGPREASRHPALRLVRQPALRLVGKPARRLVGKPALRLAGKPALRLVARPAAD